MTQKQQNSEFTYRWFPKVSLLHKLEFVRNILLSIKLLPCGWEAIVEVHEQPHGAAGRALGQVQVVAACAHALVHQSASCGGIDSVVSSWRMACHCVWTDSTL